MLDWKKSVIALEINMESNSKPSGDISLNINELKDFSFQPRWASTNRSPHFEGNVERADLPKKRSTFHKKPFSSGSNRHGGHNFKNSGRSSQEGDRVFKPIISVEFYPNDVTYDAIVSTLKSTHKTYELFNVAKMFLDKPDRFAMVLKKTPDQQDKMLYLCLDDDFVFLSEEDALRHIAEVHWEKYFDQKTCEREKPSGTFTCIHRCGITGKILCPPNYHKYHDLLREHHERFLPHVSFEKFKSKLEKITDPQEIENWRDSASHEVVYLVKDGLVNGGKKECTSFSELVSFLRQHLADKVISSSDSVRISGEIFEKMPRGPLSKSIFFIINREKKFPLNFANNLRVRLRRSGFSAYKTGTKPGISYICGIKRKFRKEGEVFADNVQKVISHIDANPRISITSLCLLCKQDIKTQERGRGENVSAGVAVSEGVPAIQQNMPSEKGDGEIDTIDREVLKDLQWLIMEGYVAEFEDGTLTSTAIIPASKGSGTGIGSNDLDSAPSQDSKGIEAPSFGDIVDPTPIALESTENSAAEDQVS